MKKLHIILFLGLCAAGFLVGYAGNRLTIERRFAVCTPSGHGNDEALNAAPAPAKPTVALPTLPAIHSTDTLASLATADAGSLYGRLALWLVDASAADIAAYWASIAGNKDRDDGIIHLIFMHWTRLDPQGAIAAVEATSFADIPWKNWACHDPQAALAAAIATDPERVKLVAMGIGRFHPTWLLEHFDEIPEAAREVAIDAMTQLNNTDQPLKVLEFLTQHQWKFHPSIFEALVRQDPWAAYDWMKNNPEMGGDPFISSDSMMSVFLKTAVESQPAALERLAAQTPSGKLKRQMETALFDRLLETDPAAAIEQASTIKAPAIAAQRLASVGLSQVHTDPDQAFETAKKLFAANPAPLATRTAVRGPDGINSIGSSSNLGVGEFMDTLAAKDPAHLMALLPPPRADGSVEMDDYQEVADKCATQDLAAYTAWVRQQTNPAILAAANPAVISGLMREQRFSEAAEWAMSSEKMRTNLSSLLGQWHQSDPAQARQWLDAAALPAADKAQLSKSLKDTP